MRLLCKLFLLVSLGVSLSCLARSAGPDEPQKKKGDTTTKSKTKKAKESKGIETSKKAAEAKKAKVADGPPACPPDCPPDRKD